MDRFIIVLFMVVFSYGSQILNISYFPSNDKIDVLFSLDEPFKGKISLIKENNYKITNLTLNRIEQKKFSNGLNLIISGIDNKSVELKIVYDKKINIKASITAKGYGLRLRLLGLKQVKDKPEYKLNNKANDIPTNNITDGFNFVNYIIVIIILIILIIVLLIIKKKAIQKLPESLQKDNYKLLYQKMIDPKNRIVLIEVFNKRYLLLLGDKNNILLDNFSSQNQEELKDISSQNQFDSLLEEKLKEDDYIKKASELKDLDGI
jgi:flagellar biogenesis protein FliO